MKNIDLSNFEERDLPFLENGEAYRIDCVLTSGGVPCIKSTTGPIEKGQNIKVFAEGRRNTYPTPNSKETMIKEHESQIYSHN